MSIIDRDIEFYIDQLKEELKHLWSCEVEEEEKYFLRVDTLMDIVRSLKIYKEMLS